jgi:hypothetical protein
VIASPDTERLFDLQKIFALRVRGSRGPLGTLLERCAGRILAIEPPPVSATSAQTSAWRTHVRTRTAALIEEIRGADDHQRRRVARQLAELPEHDRVWGRPQASRSAGSRTPASWR